LLDSNDELVYQEWTVIVHQQGYFKIWSSNCKSVHNRSIFPTQVNTRQDSYSTWNTWCTPPGTAGHTTPYTLYASKRIEAYGITLFLGLNDPRASCVRASHTPAVYPIIEIHRAAYSTADGRLIRQHTPAATYVSHMSRIVALFF
jgi:hypothetical protein